MPASLKATAALLLSLLWTAATATTFADPLHSSECLKAQQALNVFEQFNVQAAQPPASAPTVSPRLRVLRQNVARVCLATRLDAQGPQRQVQPPLSVPPVARLHALPPTQRADLAANPATVAQPALRSITHCDAAGCWASDGTRLRRMGPDLVGAKGVCQLNGSVVTCP